MITNTENKKLKVHAIEKYFMPVMAGIEVNMYETYRYLVDMACDITIHTSRDTLTEKNVLKPEETISGLKVKRYIFDKFGFWPDINWMTADVVCLHNFNIFPHFRIMFYVWVLKLLGLKRFKLFLTPHGGFTPEGSVFPPLTRAIKYIYHFTVGTIFINLSVDGVRAVSEWERREIIKFGVNKKKVVVIDNGLDNEAFEDIDSKVSPEFKQKIDSFGRYIVQIGRVYVIKNLETTIRAVAKLPKDVKYLIAGPIELNKYAGYKQQLDDLIKELGLENRVIFLGVVTGYDKYYLIKQSQMMVHMALWESFCNVVHEALSQGKVCVVADNTALKYLVKNGETGYLIPTRDHEKLAERINFVLENHSSDEVKNIAARAREFGLNHTWKSVAERMYSFYTGSKVDVNKASSKN